MSVGQRSMTQLYEVYKLSQKSTHGPAQLIQRSVKYLPKEQK